MNPLAGGIAIVAMCCCLSAGVAAGEFVDPHSGQWQVRQVDHRIHSPVGPVPIVRRHQPSAATGPLGPGWRLELASELWAPDADTVLLASAQGVRHYSRHDDAWRDAAGRVTITRQDDGQWQVVAVDGRMSRYDDLGREILRRDANGNALRFEHGDRGIERVRADNGTVAVFHYGRRGRLIRIEADNGAVSRYRYDDQGRLAAVEDPDGRSVRFQYSPAGRLSALLYPDGTRVTAERNPAGRVQALNRAGVAYRYRYGPDRTRVTRQDGYWEETRFDDQGRPLAQQDSLGRAQAWRWNPNGTLAARTLTDGSTLAYTYDSRGRLVEQTTAGGQRLTLRYEGDGDRVRSIARDGGTTRFRYDAKGNLLSLTTPAGRHFTYAYDERGRRVRDIDPEGHVTQYTYNDQGRLSSRRDPDGRMRRWVYDERGRLISERGADGRRIRYRYGDDGRLSAVARTGEVPLTLEYDPQGRLSAGGRAGRRTRYGYDKTGRLVSIRHPDGTRERYRYDDLGRPVERTDRFGQTIRQRYHGDGSVAETRYPGGFVVATQREADGRLRIRLGADQLVLQRKADSLRLQQPGGGRVSERLGPGGRVLQRTWPRGGVERREYDPDGLLSAVVLPEGDDWRFGYDGNGRLAEVRFPDGSRKTLGYDPAGRPRDVGLPWDERLHYRYDADGRLSAVTNARGQVIRYRYDSAGRITVKETPERTWTYKYDAGGRLREAGDADFSIRYRRDEHGRIVAIDYPQWGKRVGFEYDDQGRVAARILPDGQRLAYAYDARGLLAQIRGPAGRYDFEWDAAGRLAATTLPNGMRSVRQYGAADRIDAIRHLSPDGSVALGHEHDYDAEGNLSASRGPDGAAGYAYDLQGRLTRVLDAAGETRFRYGPGEQRLARLQDGERSRYRYDTAGRLIQAGATRFAYDADGNLVQRRDAAGTTRYAYDAENRLVQARLTDGRELRWGYGPFGNRIWREADGGRRYYLYAGEELLQVLDGQHRPLADYRCAAPDHPLSVTLGGGITRYYHLDRLGSVLALSDARGRITTRYSYAAFGAPLPPSGEAFDQPLRYSARPWEPDLGLYDLRARFYDPVLGRFLSVDPGAGDLDDPPSLAPYVYARNNPLRFVDPRGTQWENPIDVVLRNAPLPPYNPAQAHAVPTYDWQHGVATVMARQRGLPEGPQVPVQQRQLNLQPAGPRPSFADRPTGFAASPPSGVEDLRVPPRGSATNAAAQTVLAPPPAPAPPSGGFLQGLRNALGQAGASLSSIGNRVEAALTPLVPGAQRLSTATARGAIAIRMADALSDIYHADDAEAAMAEHAEELMLMGLTSAVAAPAIQLAASAAPASVMVGGSALGAVGLGYAAADRVEQAMEGVRERNQAELAEAAAVRQQAGVEEEIQDAAGRLLAALQAKAGRLRGLRADLSALAGQITGLEVDAANQRNAAQAAAAQAGHIRAAIQALHGKAAGIDSAAPQLADLWQQQKAIRALADQACQAGVAAPRALAARAAHGLDALAGAAHPDGAAATLSGLRDAHAEAEGLVGDSRDLKQRLQANRRSIERFVALIRQQAQTLAQKRDAALALQREIRASTLRLRYFADSVGDLSAIAAEAAAPLPAVDATALLSAAEASLAAVDVDAMLLGIGAVAQLEAAERGAALDRYRTRLDTARALLGKARADAARARECAEGRMAGTAAPADQLVEHPDPEPESPPPGPQCAEDMDCAIGYLCRDGRCLRDPAFAAGASPPGGARGGEPAGLPPDATACFGDGDCPRAQVCVGGRCATPPPGPGLDQVLGLFGERAQQRADEVGGRTSTGTDTAHGGRYTQQDLEQIRHWHQQQSAGDPDRGHGAGNPGPLVQAPPSPGGGTSAPGPPTTPGLSGGGGTSPGGAAPTAPSGGGGHRHYYLFEHTARYRQGQYDEYTCTYRDWQVVQLYPGEVEGFRGRAANTLRAAFDGGNRKLVSTRVRLVRKGDGPITKPAGQGTRCVRSK